MRKLLKDELYSIKFKDQWESIGVKNIKIIGITYSSNASNFDVDLYSEYFSKYNLGLSEYVTYIKKDTPIYICNLIKSFDPIEFESKVELLPNSIINPNKIDKLKNVERFNIDFNIEKHFDKVYERGLYLIQVQKDLREKLKLVKEVGNVNLDFNISSTNFLQTSKSYKDREDQKYELYNIAKEADYMNKQKDEIRNRNILRKQKELDDLITQNNQLKQNLQSSIIEYDSMISTFTNSIDAVEVAVYNIINLLEDSSRNLSDYLTDDYSNYENNKTDLLDSIDDINNEL